MLFVPANGFFEVEGALFEVGNFGVEQGDALVGLAQFGLRQLSSRCATRMSTSAPASLARLKMRLEMSV